MPAVTANLLKLIFIALIYLFLWQVTRAVASHVGSGTPVVKRKTGTGELIVIRSETQSGLKIPVRDSVVLGRSAEADILLDDPYASSFHMRVGISDGRMVLSDMGTTNGTYVNGRRVTNPIVLSRGDAVQVGKTIMEVR